MQRSLNDIQKKKKKKKKRYHAKKVACVMIYTKDEKHVEEVTEMN